MSKRQDSGVLGELEVVELVPCPNCGKKLMRLPIHYPLRDVQCTGCEFRVQVKTLNSKPKNEILGAGWDVMEKVTKSGYMVPPLIVNFKWEAGGITHQEIRFFPFIPKKSLKMFKLSEKHRQANYRMFKYTKLNELPHFILFSKGKK